MKIGEDFACGIFAGIARGENGRPDAYLILLRDKPDEYLTWFGATLWATSLGDGARLPTRSEAALLNANLRDQVDLDEWYWTSAQSSANTAYAQDFDDGSQDSVPKGYHFRARAVRRLSIIQ